MKRTLTGLLVLVGCATPGTPPPPKTEVVKAAEAPKDSPPVVEGDVTEAHLGGMTVLVKRVKYAELVAEQLYVRGGALNWTKANAGVEQLAFHVAASGGTSTLEKAAFARKLASLGATLGAETTVDWSVLQAKGPLAAEPAMLGLLADVFLRPALPANELEVARQRQLLDIRQTEEDPDGRLALLVDALRFKDHPYSVRPAGTMETVQALTRAQLAEHLEGLRQTSRLVLVVVGDVEAAQILAQASAAFAALPTGVPPARPPAAPPIVATTLNTEARVLATNYLEGNFTGPAMGSADYAAGVSATRVLGERLFFEIRTKRNLSYAPHAGWDFNGAGTWGGIYVTTVDPNAALKVMYEQLRRLQTEPVSAAELDGAKAQARTRMFTRQDSTDGQASVLGADLLITGDWHFRPKLNVQLQAVTAEDVQAYARKYIGKLQLVLLGDPAKLDPAVAASL